MKNLRRYPPQSGPMARCTEMVHTVPEKFYTDLNGRITPFPVSLLVQVSCILNFLLPGRPNAASNPSSMSEEWNCVIDDPV